jgi:hypothetical protein
MHLFIHCKQAVITVLLAVSINTAAQISPALKPYHDRFVAEAETRGATLAGTLSKVDFFSIDDTGYHGITIYPDRAVYVNKKYWDTLDENRRELLMFHEFAHFYLHAGHIAHRYDIMNAGPSGGQAEAYRNSRKIFIDKLFELCVEL